jgi:hypothetical protein
MGMYKFKATLMQGSSVGRVGFLREVVIDVIVTDPSLLEDWLLSLMSTLVMGFGPQD